MIDFRSMPKWLPKPARRCFAASLLRERILPRGSGRESPDQGIDPFAAVTGTILELVKIFVITRLCAA